MGLKESGLMCVQVLNRELDGEGCPCSFRSSYNLNMSMDMVSCSFLPLIVSAERNKTSLMIKKKKKIVFNFFPFFFFFLLIFMFILENCFFSGLCLKSHTALFFFFSYIFFDFCVA